MTVKPEDLEDDSGEFRALVDKIESDAHEGLERVASRTARLATTRYTKGKDHVNNTANEECDKADDLPRPENDPFPKVSFYDDEDHWLQRAMLGLATSPIVIDMHMSGDLTEPLIRLLTDYGTQLYRIYQRHDAEWCANYLAGRFGGRSETSAEVCQMHIRMEQLYPLYIPLWMDLSARMLYRAGKGFNRINGTTYEDFRMIRWDGNEVIIQPNGSLSETPSGEMDTRNMHGLPLHYEDDLRARLKMLQNSFVEANTTDDQVQTLIDQFEHDRYWILGENGLVEVFFNSDKSAFMSKEGIKFPLVWDSRGMPKTVNTYGEIVPDPQRRQDQAVALEAARIMDEEDRGVDPDLERVREAVNQQRARQASARYAKEDAAELEQRILEQVPVDDPAHRRVRFDDGEEHREPMAPPDSRDFSITRQMRRAGGSDIESSEQLAPADTHVLEPDSKAWKADLDTVEPPQSIQTRVIEGQRPNPEDPARAMTRTSVDLDKESSSEQTDIKEDGTPRNNQDVPAKVGAIKDITMTMVKVLPSNVEGTATSEEFQEISLNLLVGMTGKRITGFDENKICFTNEDEGEEFIAITLETFDPKRREDWTCFILYVEAFDSKVKEGKSPAEIPDDDTDTKADTQASAEPPYNDPDERTDDVIDSNLTSDPNLASRAPGADDEEGDKAKEDEQVELTGVPEADWMNDPAGDMSDLFGNTGDDEDDDDEEDCDFRSARTFLDDDQGQGAFPEPMSTTAPPPADTDAAGITTSEGQKPDETTTGGTMTADGMPPAGSGAPPPPAPITTIRLLLELGNTCREEDIDLTSDTFVVVGEGGHGHSSPVLGINHDASKVVTEHGESPAALIKVGRMNDLPTDVGSEMAGLNLIQGILARNNEVIGYPVNSAGAQELRVSHLTPPTMLSLRRAARTEQGLIDTNEPLGQEVLLIALDSVCGFGGESVIGLNDETKRVIVRDESGDREVLMVRSLANETEVWVHGQYEHPTRSNATPSLVNWKHLALAGAALAILVIVALRLPGSSASKMAANANGATNGSDGKNTPPTPAPTPAKKAEETWLVTNEVQQRRNQLTPPVRELSDDECLRDGMTVTHRGRTQVIRFANAGEAITVIPQLDGKWDNNCKWIRVHYHENFQWSAAIAGNDLTHPVYNLRVGYHQMRWRDDLPHNSGDPVGVMSVTIGKRADGAAQFIIEATRSDAYRRSRESPTVIGATHGLEMPKP